MISIECGVSVPGFSHKQLGYFTLARAYRAKFEFRFTNDGAKPLSRLSVRPALESYAGHEKPLLFQWRDTQAIEELLPNKETLMKCEFVPSFVGIASVALYVTDATGKAIAARRSGASNYEQAPVRWWFHIADCTLLEILAELRELRKAVKRRER